MADIEEEQRLAEEARIERALVKNKTKTSFDKKNRENREEAKKKREQEQLKKGEEANKLLQERELKQQQLQEQEKQEANSLSIVENKEPVVEEEVDKEKVDEEAMKWLAQSAGVSMEDIKSHISGTSVVTTTSSPEKITDDTSVAAAEEGRLERSFLRKKPSSSGFGKISDLALKEKRKSNASSSPLSNSNQSTTTTAPSPSRGESKEVPLVSPRWKVQSEEEKKKQQLLDQQIFERDKKWEEEKKHVKTQEYSLALKMASLASAPSSTNSLRINDEEEVKKGLTKLYEHNDPTSWLLFQYLPSNPTILSLTKIGEGTELEPIKQELKEEEIAFIVRQQLHRGEYGVISRFVLIQWIGHNVPAGIAKARASSNKAELISLCKQIVVIGGELQINSKEELTEENISTAFGSTTAKTSDSSISAARGGRGKKIEDMTYQNEEEVTSVLTEIHKGTKNWAIFAYSKSHSGVIELVESGVGGADELANRFPEDRIFFCPISVPMQPQTKNVLVTCVGSKVPPIQKARCSGEIQKVADKIKSVIPFHAFFQPIDAQDLTNANLIRKLH